MKKKILIAVGVLIGALLIMMAASAVVVGPMIRSAVNKQGPKVMGTGVKAKDVDVTLFSAGATLTDFELGNPPGFETPRAATAKEIRVRIDKKSLLTDRIVIDTIEVTAPHLYYEIQGKNDNFRALLSSMRKAAKAAEPPPGQKPSGGKKPEENMLIREVIIRDGLVDLAAAELAGKPITVPLPDLRLADIGAKEGGLTPDKAFKFILYEVYGRLQTPSFREALNDQLKVFETSIEQLRGDVRKKADDTRKERRMRPEAFTDPGNNPDNNKAAPASKGAFEG